LRHLIKVSAATALKDLKSLVDLGLQEWVGPSKKTWYVLREMRT
jgi:predicted HTH transcriptional regulator